eukprot:1888555-Rhodomonas_salina.1
MGAARALHSQESAFGFSLEVYSAQLIVDWSRPSPKDSVDAGVPMADAMGKRKLPLRKADHDLAGVFYQLARGSAEKEQCKIF